MIQRYTMSALCVLPLLFACSGDDSPQVDNPRPTEVPEIIGGRTIEGPLSQPGRNAVLRYIQHGVYASLDPSLSLPTTDAFEASAGKNFSQTNTQEQGVDEADRIKYNGDYFYVAAHPTWQNNEQVPAKVRVLKRADDYSLSEVTSLPNPIEQGNIHGLYLQQDRLAVIASDYPIWTFADTLFEPWHEGQAKVSLNIYDMQDPQNAVNLAKIEIDGTLLDSRRINNHLYLVTSYLPQVADLNPHAQSDAEKLANYLRIYDTPDSALMPHISQNGASSPLNSIDDCYMPAQAQASDGNAQLLHITRIDLTQPQTHESLCLTAQANTLYMSADNLYLIAQRFDHQGNGKHRSLIHKVSLAGEAAYQASGSVQGHLGWRSDANLRVSEYQGYLRVVTSSGTTFPDNRLFVLQQQGQQLTTIAKLPNDQQTEAIGKPGEDVYAVRFFNERAYIVTFQRIDPLYVLDLSDPEAPFIAGSLEIPGFSTYLHPLGKGYLLGVGQEVNTPVEPSDGTPPPPPNITQGLKVSLFDIRDLAQPLALNSLVFKEGYSPLEYDYRALAVLEQNGNYQFAMPLERWHSDDPQAPATRQNSLLMLEVGTQVSQPELSLKRQLALENSGSYLNGRGDRSVIHGQHIYYVRGNDVWHSLWQADAPVDGPY